MKALFARLTGLWLNLLALVWPARAGRQGFVLFCHPFRSKLKEHHREFLRSGTDFLFDYEGVNVQVYRWGDGEKRVLFLHGWQSHTFRWKAYVDALLSDASYTVYALDAPGHGLSDGSYLSLPYYSTLIDRILDRIGGVHALVGHSLGGFSTLYSYYRNPALSSRCLIVMGTPGEAADFFDLYRQTLHLSRRAERVILNHFLKVFDQPPTFFSAATFASAVQVPGLIVHDLEDPDAPHHYAEAIHAAWPHAKLVSTKGLGHNLRSPEVVEQVVQFLGKHLKEQGAVHVAGRG